MNKYNDKVRQWELDCASKRQQLKNRLIKEGLDEDERNQKLDEFDKECGKTFSKFYARVLKEQDKEKAYDFETFKQSVGGNVRDKQRCGIDMATEEVERCLMYAYNAVVESFGGMVVRGDKYLSIVIGCTARWLANPPKPCLMFRGNVGVGKTTMLRAIAETYRGLGRPTFEVRNATYINEMYKEDKAMFKELKEVPILGIDDLGVEQNAIKDWGNNVSPMVELLSHRYDKRLPTFITTNLVRSADGADEIEGRYGKRIADRLKEICNIITYDGHQPSYRR